MNSCAVSEAWPNEMLVRTMPGKKGHGPIILHPMLVDDEPAVSIRKPNMNEAVNVYYCRKETAWYC